MTIRELKDRLNDHEKSLSEHSGFGVVSSAQGPIGMQVIRLVVDAMEEQDRRITRLERRLGDIPLDEVVP